MTETGGIAAGQLVVGIGRVEALFLVQQGRCYICEKPMAFQRGATKGRVNPRRATRDHITPKERDKGDGDPSNIALACFDCNQRKGCRGIVGAVERRGRKYSLLAYQMVAHCKGFFDRLHDWVEPA